MAAGGDQTLIVDLDAQCNATVALGLAKDTDEDVSLLDGSVPTTAPLRRSTTATPHFSSSRRAASGTPFAPKFSAMISDSSVFVCSWAKEIHR